MHVIEAKQRHSREITSLCMELDCAQYTCSDANNIQRFIERHECFVAMDEGRVVAAMYLVCEEGSCEIEMLVSKKKGGGTALVEHAITICKHKGCSKLWCWSMTKYQAEGFYRKMGFTESYLLQKQWFGEDCYYFGKCIPQSTLKVSPRP